MMKRTQTARLRRGTRMRGGLIAAAALVLSLGLAGCGGDDEDTGSGDPTTAESTPVEEETTPSTEETPEETPEGTEEEPSSAPSDTAAPDDADQAAAAAPTDADVEEFCSSFDLQALSQLSGSSDLSKLQDLQKDMLAVGTPSDMPDQARSGWEWFASINGPEDLGTMNNDHLTALGEYYGLNCM